MWPDSDPTAPKMKSRDAIDFNYTNPPREVTDPIGFARLGTTRAFEEYPKHVLVGETVAETHLPGALECPDRKSTVGYPFITVHDPDQEAYALSLGYTLPPVPDRSEPTHPAVLAAQAELDAQRAAYATQQAEIEELRAMLAEAATPKKTK